MGSNCYGKQNTVLDIATPVFRSFNERFGIVNGYTDCEQMLDAELYLLLLYLHGEQMLDAELYILLLYLYVESYFPNYGYKRD